MGSKVIMLTKVEDLKKLEGWMVKAIQPLPGSPPGLRLILSHPVAENAISLTLMPHVVLGLNGTVVMASAELKMSLDDL